MMDSFNSELKSRNPMLLQGNNSNLNSSKEDDGDFMNSFDWSTDHLMRYSPGISSIYCIAYSIVFIMGIIGNSCVVAVVVRSPRMRTVTNYFIVNLALADILVLLFCLPATLLSNLFIRKFIHLFPVKYNSPTRDQMSIPRCTVCNLKSLCRFCSPLSLSALLTSIFICGR